MRKELDSSKMGRNSSLSDSKRQVGSSKDIAFHEVLENGNLASPNFGECSYIDSKNVSRPMATTRLYNNDEGNYAFRVAPHWATGISLPQSERPGAQPMRLFLCPPFLVGCIRALRSAAPRSGKANLVQSASSQLVLLGGGSQPYPRIAI